MDKVRKAKLEVKPGVLCSGMEKCFLDMLVHARSVAFDQAPDYHLLRKGIRAGLQKLGASYDPLTQG